jgi:hypothetical protein
VVANYELADRHPKLREIRPAQTTQEKMFPGRAHGIVNPEPDKSVQLVCTICEASETTLVGKL